MPTTSASDGKLNQLTEKFHQKMEESRQIGEQTQVLLAVRDNILKDADDLLREMMKIRDKRSESEIAFSRSGPLAAESIPETPLSD